MSTQVDGGRVEDDDGRPGERVRRARQAAGMTLADLAERLGVSKSQVSLWESGKRSLSDEWAAAIEAALGVDDGSIVEAVRWAETPASVRAQVAASADLADRLRDAARRGVSLDDLLARGELGRLVESASGNIESPRMLAARIPVINKVSAGYPAEFTDLDYPARVADAYVACPDVTDADAFAARVVGDSMAPAYREGEIVVFSPSAAVDSGCDCFVRFEDRGESTFKRVFFDDEATVRLQPLNSAYPPRTVKRVEVGGMYRAVYVMRAVG